MGRLLLALVLGGGIFAFLAWQLGFITSTDVAPPGGSDDNPMAAFKAPPPELGGDLFAPAAYPPAPARQNFRKVDPVAVLGTMAVIDRPDIPAQIPGQLIFIGEQIPEGACQLAGVAAFLAPPFDYAKVNHGAEDVIKFYRRLYENDLVYQDQCLGLIDPAKSLGDLDMKRSKVIAAKADSDGAKAIAEEAENKLKTAQVLYGRNQAISLEDLRSAQLTRDKMWFDSIAKEKAWFMAKDEENMSRIIYKQHEIRNRIPVQRGVIQKIYKQRGDGVKELEPVMQINGLDRLMAEAQVDQEFGRQLRNGMLVTIEPSIVDSPPKTYRGHVAAVNCVAITHAAKDPLIVSGGDDRSVFLWNRFEQSPIREFKHPEAVRALATSPPGAARNLVVTGCADGSIRLFDLDVQENDKALIKEVKEHSVAVTAVAFSRDGKYFASGAADGTIMLWATDKVETVYAFDETHGVFDPHHGAITALHFTPQCRLVSASLDNTIRVWTLKEKGAALAYEPLGGRSGTVNQIDVSSDGRWLLFDQGKTLQIRSVADGRMVNTLQNPGGVIPFETLAAFSPDASLLLTAGVGDGRLQLWRTPTETARGFEIRQLATRERAPVSCAAFAPRSDYSGEGSFAVSGNREGQLYLWPLPSQTEVETHPIRNVRVRLINAGLNPSTRQISIGVEVPNPPTPDHPKGRLEPGRSVTIVIE